MEFFAWVCVFVFAVFLGVNASSVRVSPEEWTKAEQLCSKNDGVDKFIARTLDDNSVFCKNSARFTLKDEKK